MVKIYDPRDWYWEIAGVAGRYSSKRKQQVPPGDAAYRAWAADGGVATKIGTEDELRDVLAAWDMGYLAEKPRMPNDDPRWRQLVRWLAADKGKTAAQILQEIRNA